MTVDELKTYVVNAEWFTRLGQFPGGPGRVPLPNLEAWRHNGLGKFVDPSPSIPDDMIWLPTSWGQEDPIHGEALRAAAIQLGREQTIRQVGLDMYKTALRSLRAMDRQQGLFRVGASNFANAAEGAALYAVRQAVSEIMVKQEGFYCALIPLYAAGYWPCGITTQGELVVL